MFKKMTKKSVYFAVFILFLSGVISCEKDFQDIGTSVISNTEFEIDGELMDIEITNKAITSVRADGLALGGALGQYLLGVYNNPNYEKIEASIVSQLTIQPDLKVVEIEYGVDTTVVTTIDTAFLKLPYQATLIDANSGSVAFKLDSIIGDQTRAFTVNIYQSDTYLSSLNPSDPSKQNRYDSDAIYQKIGGELNATLNYQFIPNANDTVIVIKRKLNTGDVYDLDTIALENKNPFAKIPLNEAKIKQLFLDKFGSDEFASQSAFNDYFKGLYIEASGNEGALISFNINNSIPRLRPSIEVYYTNTVYKGGVAIDTIKRNEVFFMSNFSNSIYKMTEKTYPVDNNVIIQGTGGNIAEINLFGPDNNNNNIADQIEEIRQEKWLINEALLTLYVNQDIVQFDTIATPFRLFLYKTDPSTPSQIKDILSEGEFFYGGNLEISDKKPNKYVFRITDYISDLLHNNSNYNPTLGLKVFNSTDIPTTVIDTVLRPYSWNPKAVTLLNHLILNGDRRAQLKISYSIKKE